jgi:NAD(P)-dependent dehydrogenase (short-subunit alcohol dehydrogenase family)
MADEGRTAIITGGTGGIGIHTAIGIAKTGARVIVTGRSRDRGEAACRRIREESGNRRVDLVLGDVSSIAGVDALATELLSSVGGKLDVLVNNAGYFGNQPKTSDDGYEMHFAVNVLAPWRLTYAMLPALKNSAAARVINLTAGDNAPGTPVPLDIDNLEAEKGFKGLMTMAHSKSVMEAMSLALSRELQPIGITVNVVFPGRASTELTRSVTCSGLPGALKCFWCCMKCMFRNDGGKGAEKASRSTIFCATSNELDGVTGSYIDQNCKKLQPHPKALDTTSQARIVALIEKVGATPNRLSASTQDSAVA